MTDRTTPSDTPVRQNPRWFFLLSVAILGIIGIMAVYSLRLNFPPIRSDGLGYYLYLPATFIYHDLSLQSIAEVFNNGHIPDVTPSLWQYSGPALWEDSTNYLIKYPLGEALLMLPFFFLACIAAFVTDTPVDGFSPLFQYAAAIAGLFYAIAGIAILWKVLERRFRQNTILLAMVGMVFGTNLFHYATYDSVFSHVYSFFLCSAFLYIIQRIYSQDSARYFISGGALAGLIVITRPTNGLWLLFAIFYGVDSLHALSDRLSFWKRHVTKVVYGVLPCACVISLQLLYWKIITGHFVVFSYRGEYFNFARPEIFNVLFSVRKGLFFWSPILLLVIPGLYYVRKGAREFLAPTLLFLPLNIYVISAWHSWFYGGSFGHRAFIESLPLFAICFCSLYEGSSSLFWKRFMIVLTLLCVILSTWLMLKYWTGVIPFDGTTWDYFVKTFFNLTSR
ncbi:hypothetical protein [Geobacter sp. AOG1]|uniref:hypothetical protein n=1 Tax=Geobacter sp. AOG1 TaxID=1566346 RepID=UPI001CC5B930|nr:hypothetical protein [Geobacter sp. AOG1]GFE57823.1 hypothetical protein AOG1_17030 [Geobacter sp. AOG1]